MGDKDLYSYDKTFLSALLTVGSFLGWSQSLPFDFESATSGMVGYDGATFTIVANPDTVEIAAAMWQKLSRSMSTTCGQGKSRRYPR